MAFWNFCHDTLHMHVWMLPSLIGGLGMLITGLTHKKKQDDREKDYNDQLAGAKEA